MTSAAHEQELPPANAALLRERAKELKALAEHHGITKLRIAGRPGWLVGALGRGRGMLDHAQFKVEAEHLLSAGVEFFSERVLSRDGVSPELLDTTPL